MAATTTTHSPNYENLRRQYQMGYIKKSTLKGYVSLYPILPHIGITGQEYYEITGEIYA